jgi:hypothetical protein
MSVEFIINVDRKNVVSIFEISRWRNGNIFIIKSKWRLKRPSNPKIGHMQIDRVLGDNIDKSKLLL